MPREFGVGFPSRRSLADDVVAVVLAGGRGTRLDPLTRDRAKPAVPFAGSHRIIDFTLSNCVNSGIRRVFVLTQYAPGSLERHLVQGWTHLFRGALGERLEILAPREDAGGRRYRGTADAVFRNLDLLEASRPRMVIVLAGDHVYRMDYAELALAHADSGADVTVVAIPVPIAEAAGFGTLRVDAAGRVREFREKSPEPPGGAGRDGTCLASTGVYCFSWECLRECLGPERGGGHDFGHDILPAAVASRAVSAFPFGGTPASRKLTGGYWRDVGTIDSYFGAHLDLLAPQPGLDLADDAWPVHTVPSALPPARFLSVRGGGRPLRGTATDSLVCNAAVLEGGVAVRSILGPRARIGARARVEECVLLDGVVVGAGARLRRTIVDRGVRIPDGVAIGFDRASDEAAGLTVSPGGVTVVSRCHPFPAAPSAVPVGVPAAIGPPVSAPAPPRRPR